MAGLAKEQDDALTTKVAAEKNEKEADLQEKDLEKSVTDLKDEIDQ